MIFDRCEYPGCDREAIVVHLDPCFGPNAACDEHAARTAPCCAQPATCDHDWCDEHGAVTIVDAGSSAGYAGPIYWAKLSCGCQELDLSNDNAEAAR